MRKFIFSCILLCVVGAVLAEEVTIRTKDNQTLEGIIVGKQGDTLYLATKDRTISIGKESIREIVRDNRAITRGVFRQNDFMYATEDEITDYESVILPEKNAIESNIQDYRASQTHSRTYLIPVSLLSAALAIDYFCDAGEMDDEIGTARGDERKKLVKMRTRKYIMGGLCTLVAIINSAIALDEEPVKVYTDGQHLGLSITYL